ncbi:hypothetical protein DFP72DRAFT_881748 [Ephemerocybe angulata]|uniref:MYND-type domain-containing protein n=1 Tax=Ephemerocybe angulata TaxID=980116 RepID=A0A8H6IAI4_9AGAR|nr:hypothetical protein DFP72DRAFT_881748 [Tulosesus angulatus]
MSGSRQQQRRKGITDQLVAAVNGGSVDSLRRLQGMIERDPSDCTLEVIQLVTTHLGADQAAAPKNDPSRRDSRHPPCEICFACVEMLSPIISALHRDKLLKESALNLLTLAIDGVCLSIDHLLFPSDDGNLAIQGRVVSRKLSPFQHSRTLLALLELDPSLAKFVVSSPAFCDLLIRMWTFSDERNRVWADLADSTGCSLSTLMSRSLLDSEEHSSDVLFQRISVRKAHAVDFPKKTIARATSAYEYLLERSDFSRADRVMAFFSQLIIVVRDLISDNDELRREFLDYNYLKKLATALNAITLHISTRIRPGEQVASVREFIVPVYTLSRLACLGSVRVVRNWRDLLSGGYLPLLMRIMGKVSLLFETMGPFGEGRHVPMARGAIEMLVCHSAYPIVVAELIELDFLGLKTGDYARCHPALDPAWRHFWECNTYRIEALNGMPKDGVHICDNYTCTHRYHATQVSKECSGCYSVVYCSPECQSEDWEKWHRHECSKARADHSRLKSCDEWYSHQNRAYHLAYVQLMYTNLVGLYEGDAKRRFGPSVPFHQVMPTMDFRAVITTYNLKPIGPDFIQVERETWVGQEYLEPRMQAFLDEYRSGALAARGARLVKAKFRMGDQLMTLFVKLERAREGYVSTYGLVCYA